MMKTSVSGLNHLSVFHHPEESPKYIIVVCKLNDKACMHHKTCLNQVFPQISPLFYLEHLNCLAILTNIPFIIIPYGMSPYLLLIF